MVKFFQDLAAADVQTLLIMGMFVTLCGLGLSRLVKTLKVKRLKIGGNEVDFSDSEITRRAPTDSICNDRVAIILTEVKVILAVQIKIDHIYHFELLSDQMKHTEIMVERFVGDAQSVFLKTLKEARGGSKENLVDSLEYLTYRNALRVVQSDIIDHLRTSYKENHLNEMSEAEFREFSMSKSDQIQQMITNILNATYRGELVTREEIYDVNLITLQPALLIEIRDVLSHAREVAKESKEKVVKYEEEIGKALNGVDKRIRKLLMS